MKKLIVLGAVALFGLSNAQIAQGSTYVSGTLNYQGLRDNNEETKVDDYKFVPTVGYFVADNFAIGVGVGYAANVAKQDFSNRYDKDTNSAIVVEPFARKYWTLGDKLYFFGQLSVPLEFGKVKSETVFADFPEDNVENEAKYTSYGVALKPGLDYFLNKNWTVEATIGEFSYKTSKFDVDGAKSNDNLNLGFNLKSVTLGVKYVFGGTKN